TSRRNVAAPRNASRTTVVDTALACVLLGQKSVDDTCFRVERGKDLVLADEMAGSRARGESRRGIGIDARLDGMALLDPCREAAVENPRGIEAVSLQHPPHPSGPGTIGAIVKHDARPLADAELAGGLRESRGLEQ